MRFLSTSITDIKIFPYLLFFFVATHSAIYAQSYRMPGEDLPHEGTWLQWPHNDLYGPFYQDDVQPTFVGMASALQAGEKVHIIAKDQAHENQILAALNNASVPLNNIDFYTYPTNDVWVRDNGPIFVYDSTDALVMLDWGFNGWGNDTPFALCDEIPQLVSADNQLPVIDLSAMVLEGGAIEHDGQGTMMATRSSVTHPSRNPNLTEQQIEDYLQSYMGFTKFIWLDGVYGLEITDMHIDGFVKFANDSTIVTMDTTDLTYWEVPVADQTTLFNAANVNNEPYQFVQVPLTQNDVTTTYGNNLGYKGSYVNYYIGNDVVIVPTYNDPNDNVAIGIIQGVHPNRTVVGVDVRNIYEYGGMIHCLTQQQPEQLPTAGIQGLNKSQIDVIPKPNPASQTTIIPIPEDTKGEVVLRVYNANGQEVYSEVFQIQGSTNELKLNVENFANGVYTYIIELGKNQTQTSKLIVSK